jgi:voltage-gated potassium channel Kch
MDAQGTQRDEVPRSTTGRLIPGSHPSWWWLSTIAATASLALSYIAFCMSLDQKGLSKFVEALYSSAQLLLLNVPHDSLPTHEKFRLARGLLHVARCLAVIAVGATGVALVMQFFGRELRRSWTAWRGNHTVICGLNRIGQCLAEEFCQAGDRVVAIDAGADNAALVSATGSGANLVLGDAGQALALRRAGVQRARYVFAVSNDDAANLITALNTLKIARNGRIHVFGRPEIFTHVTSPQLRTSLRRKRAFATDEHGPRVRIFDAFENSARSLFWNYPLDYEQIAEHDERVVQIVIVGFGRMAEELLIRATLVGHFANLKRLRAVVVDRHADRKESLFRSRYKAFGELCDAEFISSDAEEQSTQARIAELCDDSKKTISTIAICFGNDSRGLSLALSLADHLSPSVPIRVRLDEESGLAAFLEGRNSLGTLPIQVTAFGSLRQACARKNWISHELDIMAKATHADYVRRQRAHHQTFPEDRNLRDWEQLDDDLVESNRQLADHIPVKIRALGYHIVPRDNHDPGKLVKQFTEKQVELLAKIEHRRWAAERLLSGWLRGPKDLDNLISPYFVEWESLAPDIQDHDRDFARILPGLLDLANMEIRQ